MTLQEIQNNVKFLEHQYEVFDFVSKEIEAINTEIAQHSKLDTLEAKIKIDKLTKKREELEAKESQYVVDYYNELYKKAYLIDVHKFFSDALDNDKELKNSKREYENAKNKMLEVAAKHNLLVSKKKSEAIDLVRSTGYSEIIEKIADNDTAQILGMRRPTDRTKDYFNQSHYISIPLGLNDEYEVVLKEQEKKSKKGKFLF